MEHFQAEVMSSVELKWIHKKPIREEGACNGLNKGQKENGNQNSAADGNNSRGKNPGVTDYNSAGNWLL